MLFSSYVFVLLFLPLALLLFYGAAHWRGASAARYVLIATSLLFYGWWNPVYIGLMMSSVLFNFFCAQLMQKWYEPALALKKKRVLQVGILANLLLLGYFKYANFFIANMNAAMGADFPLLNLVLPLAISFFTLMQIAFLVDVYEGTTEENSFASYLWFVVFFPHLIAGPIVTHREMAPQYRSGNFARFQDKTFAYGLFVFAVGLFKKVVIADSIAPIADAGFNDVASLGMLDAWYVSTAYTLQAYFDFSGYSDMAVGLGLLFGITLPINFKSPYKATSIIRFWQCWHVSLTDFINAYLYMPLNRLRQQFSFHYSLMVTVVVMIVVGLWHGASWTFICWGFLHGLALVVNHLWRRLPVKMPAWLGWMLTLFWWHLTLVMFRSNSIAEAVAMYQTLFFGEVRSLGRPVLEAFSALKHLPPEIESGLLAAGFVGLFVCCVLLRNPHDHANSFKPSLKYFGVTFLCLVTSLLLMGHVAEFIYFQF